METNFKLGLAVFPCKYGLNARVLGLTFVAVLVTFICCSVFYSVNIIMFLAKITSSNYYFG